MDFQKKIRWVLLLTLSALVFADSCKCKKADSCKSIQASEEEKFKYFLDSLKKSDAPEPEKIDEIRRYLAKIIDLGKSKDSLAYNYYKIQWDSIQVFKCIESFRKNNLTAECGFTSYILSKLYKHAGYDTYIYKCGFNAKMTRHQFVLVKMNDRLVVEDAFYNITIVDTNNLHKDFILLLSEIKARDFSNIHVIQENVESELWFDSSAEMDSLLSSGQEYNSLFNTQVKTTVFEDNRLKLLIIRNYQSFIQPSFEKMKPLLKAEGLNENYLSVYLKPLQIKNSSGSDADSLKKQIEHLIGKPFINSSIVPQ